MKFGIGGLECIVERVARKMSMETILDEAFSKLGEKRQVGYWTVIGKVVRVKRRLLY